jgi:tRNA-splicing ligase RtcB
LSRGEAARSLNQRDIDREYAEAGILVNTNGRVPIDEAAPCYKPSEEVIESVTGAGLAKIEYRLWPVASLKGEDERKIKKMKRGGKKKSSNHY